MTDPEDPVPMAPRDFSLVLGGPLYQLFRRAHLAGNAMELLRRRVIVLTAVAWAPLLVLTIAEGTAWGGRVALPFLREAALDVATWYRLPADGGLRTSLAGRWLTRAIRDGVLRNAIPAPRPSSDATS